MGDGKMNRYWFEHWKQGQIVGIEICLANSVSEAISQLSDKFSGVFRLGDKQTEQQRYKENLKQLERIAGE